MAFEKPLPEWNATGERPEQEIIDGGWDPGYKPPAEWMNWWMNVTYEALKEMRDQITPSGGIIMWSGTYAEIPEGWNLCDGNNGTPDLQDRFILGASSESEIGSIGGSHEVTLTENEMPSHNHSGSASTDGSHYHYLTEYNHDSGSYGTPDSEVASGSSYGKTLSSGSHSHTINIGDSGGGQPHENRPEFYKLAFIMKA